MSMDASLPFGVYESAVTRRLRERMAATNARFATVSGAEEPARDRYIAALSRTIVEHLRTALESTKNEADRLHLINAVAHLIDPDDTIEQELLLHAVYAPTLGEEPHLPPTSLAGSALLTNAGSDQNMASEIRREIHTADQVDLLCAFVKNSGISVIRNELEYLRDKGVPLRVITSTYCGASDATASRKLTEEFGAQVKVGYESTTTRLHAKAWLFRRKSGFDSAYIGSSNLSRSALIDGVEWNIRATRASTPDIVDRFQKVFDTYWNSKHYTTFTAADTLRLQAALKQASPESSSRSLTLAGLRVEPWPYQEAMLDALTAERSAHGHHRNLLVAATGTGKTVVAALDYRGLAETAGRRPTLLFVAHRTQLLHQARAVFREVLQDPSFGEILAGNHTVEEGRHVFATIQSVHTRLDQFAPDAFDMVIVDEFHHAEARTYRTLLDYVQPRELLGLTATPERADGTNVAEFFDHRVAYELRLWDALALQLVAPMHYYGISDGTDLRDVRWSRTSSAYDVEELSDFYIRMGDRRVRLILSEIEKHIFDVEDMKALGFCVSIAHAEYMAHRFTALGVPAQAVTSANDPESRDRAISALKDGRLKALFTVDLFNEGVDIPEANTLLLLRPTASPTVFLQQLGRGLRLYKDKVCTVLDFIGQQHEEFGFAPRYAALTGRRGKRLTQEIENGFPHLPGGSSIHLDAVTQAQVLGNIKAATKNSLPALRRLVAAEGTTSLTAFLANTHLELEDLYRSKNHGGWTRLLRSASLIDATPTPPNEEFFLNRVRAFLHVNDAERAEAYLRILDPAGLSASSMGDQDLRFLRMLAVNVWAYQPVATHPQDLDSALRTLREQHTFRKELEQVFAWTTAHSRVVPEQMGATVLSMHADYSRAELTAALREESLKNLLNLPREGVYYLPEQNIDLLFVTLIKNEDDFSETTRYEDVPLSRELFQWESQSQTTLDSATGQRYLHHQELGSQVVLCVRVEKSTALGTAAPFTLLGPVNYVSHRGEKPIRIEWALERRMPAEIFEAGRAAV